MLIYIKHSKVLMLTLHYVIIVKRKKLKLYKNDALNWNIPY